MAGRNAIQVGIKMRPLLSKERERDMMALWNLTESTICVEGSQSDPFCFDYVFDQDASNQVIFDKMAKHIVHSAVEGFNGTIFAYGQTASGKTYTMMGEENDPGVMVLAAKEIFNEIDRKSNFQFLLRGGFIEIYNEKINDLLSKSNQELKIHDGPNGNAQVNCKEFCITTEDQLLELLRVGNEYRTVGETNMNERSSRSHAIFRLIIESRQTDSDIPEDDVVIQSVLNLVDLAGSERAYLTGAQGARLKEGGHINKSLLFLSNVIKRLSENGDYINYRDSKLTRILQASLGGNAFTSIICTVNPTSLEETQSTLNFAMSAKSIKNKPRVNEMVSEATMMKRLNREIKDLKKELDEERRKNASQLKVAQIEKNLDVIELKFVTSSTLHSSRTKNENRRRTWCSETKNTPDRSSSVSVQSSNPFVKDLLVSGKQPPKFNVHLTPHVAVRDAFVERKFPKQTEMECLDEEFESAEFIDFNNFNLSLKTPNQPNSEDTKFLELSLSPDTKNTTQYVKLLEEKYQALQEFANLEKELGVQHDLYGNLKHRHEATCERNKMLENERVQYLATKNELDILKEQFINSEICCDKLQVQIVKFTNDKLTADNKIAKYESELKQLKSKLQNLELENNNTNSLQFEYETYRTKSKNREKDLLELLEDKDQQISSLETQLLQNGKNEHKEVPNGNLEISIENGYDTNSTLGCHKCKNLQELMDENKKVKLEFEQLTEQYRGLQESYQELTAKAVTVEKQLTELNQWQNEETSKSKDCERELREEISVLRLKLENVKRDYSEVKYELDIKSENCGTLSREVESASKQLCMLENKYAILEGNWQKREETIAIIKADYEALEKKYNELKTSYENLELNSNKCSTDCVRLQTENDVLQNEIQNLKIRIEETQNQLLNGWKTTLNNDNEFSIIKENECLQPTGSYLELRSENDILKEQLKGLQSQYEHVQQECDQLSTNVMETIQENDTLMAKFKSLEEERKSWDSERENLEGKINELQNQLDVKSPRISTATSGVLMSDDELHDNYANENDNDLLPRQVKRIESDCRLNKRQTFTAVDLKSKATDLESKSKSNRLSLDGNYCKGNINFNEKIAINAKTEFGVHKDRKDENEETILELLKKIEDLEAQIKLLQSENQALVESSQRSINDMRDQIQCLTKELCEKSMVLDDLLKEKEEITLLNEELQIQIATSLSNINISSNYGNQTICYESNTSEKEEEVSYIPENFGGDELKALGLKFKLKEEECNRLKLEMLQRLEMVENDFRCNLRKYNEEWEQKSLKYELKIKKLEHNLSDGKCSIKTEEDQNGIERSLSPNVVKREILEGDGQLELVESYASFHEDNKSSTPNTPTTSASVPINKYFVLELEKSRSEYSQMVKECNEQLSCLSKTLAEKEEVLLEKDSEIDNLLLSIETIKAKDVSRKNDEIEKSKAELETYEHKIHVLEERIAGFEKEKELNTDNDIATKRICESEQEVMNFETFQLNHKNEVKKLESALNEALRTTNEAKEESKSLQLNKDATEKNLNRLQKQYDTIVAERDCFLGRVDELIKKYNVLTTKMNGIEQERIDLQNRLEIIIKEKLELENQVEETKMEKLNAETGNKILETCQQKLNETLTLKQHLLQELEEARLQQSASQEEMGVMKDKLDALIDIDGERSRLHSKLIILQSELEQTKNIHEKEIFDLSKALEKSKQTSNKLEEKTQELNLKVDNLSQELYESRQHAVSLEKSLHEYEGMEKQLEDVSQQKIEIELVNNRLREELKQLKNNIEESAHCERNVLETQINELQESYSSIIEKETKLRQQVLELQTEIKEEQIKSQRGIVEMQSQLKELQLKNEALKESNDQLVDKNKEIQQRLLSLQGEITESVKLRKHVRELEDEKRNVKNSLNENQKLVVSLQMKMGEKETALKELHLVLNSKQTAFETAKHKLEGAIAKLQGENKILSERLELVYEINRKRTEVCDSANNSLETKSLQNSPLARWSPCMANNAEDKVLSVQKERKNRRLSTHDENRRQSAKFSVSADASTMTDPLMNNCECNELRQNLKDIKTELYIRQSQVTALNLELRNHPWKSEKALLVKRIQEEQEKNRLDIKKYNAKITEQLAKIQEFTNKATIAATVNVPVKVESDSSTCTSPKKNLKTSETQTDSEIDLCLQKLQGKYNDIKNICRSRHNRIKELEKILEEKENILRGQCAAASRQHPEVLTTNSSSQKISNEM